MSNSTVFNTNNTGHLTGHLPAFLGDDMGVGSDVDVTFPRIDQLKDLQRSLFWSPNEVSMTADRNDVLKADKVALELMTLNIKFQQGLDSVASKTIGAMLLPHATNPEVVGMVNEWSRMEQIHMESYSYIIRQVFDDPREIIKEIYDDIEIHSRIETVTDVFDEVYNMEKSEPLETKKRKIALALVALLAMEGVSFQSSFSVTFQVAEATKLFAGIAETVSKICNDELIHSVMSYELIQATLRDGWGYVYDDLQEEIGAILDAVVVSELNWVDYLFSHGREAGVLGLNIDNLKEQVYFFADNAYQMLDIKNPHTVPKDIPIKSFDKYADRSTIQTANQEIQNTSYLVTSVENDVTEETRLTATSPIF